jgi:Ser/Thr protein kinase RdoA (MazF antagonist)
MASERIIGCWEGASSSQPVHGDLWPGNLLSGPHGLRAIDFAEAGGGPRTIDLATALRWMPWRDDPAGAARSWQAWLAGYTEAGTLSQAELDSVPHVACLQHLIWMEAEVGTSLDLAESSWYIEDHCSAIRALMAAS